jgi:hypothetical protein
VNIKEPFCDRDRVSNVRHVDPACIWPVPFVGGTFDLCDEGFEIPVLAPLL